MNSEQKEITLERAEMWCCRFYYEAREGSLLALAAGDTIRYKTLTREKYEWLSAALVIDELIEQGSTVPDAQGGQEPDGPPTA